MTTPTSRCRDVRASTAAAPAADEKRGARRSSALRWKRENRGRLLLFHYMEGRQPRASFPSFAPRYLLSLSLSLDRFNCFLSLSLFPSPFLLPSLPSRSASVCLTSKAPCFQQQGMREKESALCYNHHARRSSISFLPGFVRSPPSFLRFSVPARSTLLGSTFHFYQPVFLTPLEISASLSYPPSRSVFRLSRRSPSDGRADPTFATTVAATLPPILNDQLPRLPPPRPL